MTILEFTLPCLSVLNKEKWNLNLKKSCITYSIIFWLNVHLYKGRPTNSGRQNTSFSNSASVHHDPLLFYYCPPLVSMLQLPPPISNVSSLQIFFHRIQPPNIRSACSSSALLFYGILASCKSLIHAFYSNVPTNSNSLLWSPPPVTLLWNRNPSLRFSASSSLNIMVWNFKWDVFSASFSSSKSYP